MLHSPRMRALQIEKGRRYPCPQDFVGIGKLMKEFRKVSLEESKK